MAKLDRLKGAFLPTKLKKDHTFTGTVDVQLLHGTNLIVGASKYSLSIGKDVTISEASDAGTLNIGTNTFYFSQTGGTATLKINGTAYYLTNIG